MKPEIKELFTESVQKEAARRFAFDSDTIEPLGGFENFVCQTKRDGKPYILRLTHNSHREEDQVQAELAWVNYLAENNAMVCQPLRSESGALVEVLDNGQFLAVVFEKAAGQMVKRDDVTDNMNYNRGRLIGKLHCLTKEFNPPENGHKRPAWYEDGDFAHFERYIPASDKIVIKRLAEHFEQIKEMATDKESYGLIHCDAHTGNIFFDNEKPTLFDFDDCAYDFFISDIAISLFYAINMLPDDVSTEKKTEEFLTNFLKGYREENSLDNKWLKIIPMILKRREMVLYSAIHRAMDINNLDDWLSRYLTEKKITIENNVPVVEIDFEQFAA